MVTATEFARQAGDREAIRDCLYRYARGVDRCDEALVRSAFWPDAVADWASFKGNPDELIAWAWPQLQGMEQTVHNLGNMLIGCDDGTARTETYLTAYHRLPGEGGAKTDLIVAARYLDRFEKRNDEWRIIHRVVVQEWYRHFQDSAAWGDGLFGGKLRLGERGDADPSYAMLHGRP